MFNFIKKNDTKSVNENSVVTQKSYVVDEYTPAEEPKNVHGEDGVCCGSCGGE